MVPGIVSVGATMLEARWQRPRVCKWTVYGKVELDSKAGQERARTGTRTRRDKTLMFAAGRLDTIYLLWESPSGNLSRDADYLRVPS